MKVWGEASEITPEMWERLKSIDPRTFRAQFMQQPIPQDLAICRRCRKVAGSYRGRYGDECMCEEEERTRFLQRKSARGYALTPDEVDFLRSRGLGLRRN